MRRIVKKIPLGEWQERIVIVLETEPSLIDTAHKDLFELLRQLSDQPSILDCQAKIPDSIKFTHNGTNWIVEAQAVVDKGHYEEATSKPRGTSD